MGRTPRSSWTLRGRQLAALVETDIRQRYLGSWLGLLWAVIQPLVLILLYVFVFAVVLQVKVGASGGPVQYGLFQLAGFVVWRPMQEVLGRAPTCVIQQAGLVQKVALPGYMLPISIALSSLVTMAIDLALLILVMAVIGERFSWSILWILPLVPWLLVFLCAVSVLASTLHVRYRDTAHVCQVLSIVWFLGTPIIYPLDLVPPTLSGIVQWNPLTAPVQVARYGLLGSAGPEPESLLAAGVATVVLGLAAWWVHRRWSRTMIDRL